MNSLYEELVERMRGEVTDLERVVQRALKSWPQAQKASGEQDAYLDSVALNPHSFYSGIGTATKLDDIFFLKRIPVNTFDDLSLFEAKLQGGYDWLHKLQYLVKSIKRLQ